jgi:2-dehydropantoate 2-reductase
MAWDFKSIAIVGSGAIGLYYGGRLALAGENVKFLLRSDFGTISKHGLRVESAAGDFELPAVQAFRSAAEIGPVDLVIVCWKATANDQLAVVLPPLLHDTTQVLTLQNGLGNCEAIAAVGGAGRVLGGLCAVGINRLSSGVVRHTTGGKITVGEFSADARGRAAEIVKRFKAANIPAAAVDNLQRAQWEKLVWNIPFNGLAVAAGGVTTDVLLENPATEAEIRRLMNEVVDAANAQGLGVDRALVDWNIERTKPMAAYKPSTMIDFVEGRELELGPIWEEPLRRAELAGVKMPALEDLLERIKLKIIERDSKTNDR